MKDSVTNPERLIRLALSEDDAEMAISQAQGLKKPELESLLVSLGVPAHNARSAKELRSRLAEAVKHLTKSALESRSKASTLSRLNRGLEDALSKQLRHLEGYIGAPTSAFALSRLSDAAFADPHGAGREEVALLWQGEVDLARLALESFQEPRKEA